MRSYRTEIVVPPDRVLVLHLPEDLPEGRASVIILPLTEPPVHKLVENESEPCDELDFKSRDMEWWEEFEEEPTRHY